MSVYCKFYDNKQSLISEQIVSNSSVFIPVNAVSGLFYDNTYKLDGLKLTFNNLIANDFSFDFAKDYFLYVFPAGYSEILATSVRSSSYLTYVPDLTQNDVDYLKNLSDNSAIDFSTIVTALNSITSALSSLSNLTNLSNLADLANIITAINNKDNQSDIVNELRYIFTQSLNESSIRQINGKNNLSMFKTFISSNNLSNNDNLSRFSFASRLTALVNCFSYINYTAIDSTFADSDNKLLNRILYSFSNFPTSFPVLQQFSNTSKLNSMQNIETKLEQNLPFTTIVNNDYIDNCVSASVAYNKKIENIPFN